RKRYDVISALKKHCIAYHSDFHSVHPTPTEYLADAGFLDGVAEFVRREGDGAADVRRIFGVKTLGCYGQPGSSWAAQAVAGLKQIGVAPAGVPCYVDEGDHVGLNNKPFWYANALNVYHMGRNYTRMDLHDPAAVEPAKEKVSEIAARLGKEDGGGLISIFYHPCEWVHQQFWDGVNFSRGTNPPRAEWKAPAQRTAQETQGAFQRFGEYVDHIRAIPGVRFVTAEDLPALYPDLARRQGATGTELLQVAQLIGKQAPNGLDFSLVGSKAFSVADQFDLLSEALAQLIERKEVKFPLNLKGAFGPDAMAASNAVPEHIQATAFLAAVLDARDFVRTHGRVPSRVFIGAETVSPSDFMVGMASMYLRAADTGKLAGGEVSLGHNTSVLSSKYIAEDKPNLFGGWIIHKEGFRAPKVLEIARLQTWTLKPAIHR
ncbi:MAG: hypothetical protein JWM16_837, partial [Verrucomicrobiales bacterium]|nr:hypothetical protein [Verrucomicrobiales bacterium]